jgi:predicted dienelactone hydrolase
MLPLVVVSHGRRSHLVMHHDLAETLADGAFIVAAINHAGDNYFDQSRSAELSVMLQRPTEIKRLIDFMLTASPLAATIDRERIGVFGFSRGGHTGLARCGGRPLAWVPSRGRNRKFVTHCWREGGFEPLVPLR